MAKQKTPPRHDCMTQAHKIAMGNLPRTHANCIEKTGVARPGKTKRDRLLRGDAR